MHLLPGFEFLKIKSVLYDTDNTPKNVTGSEGLSRQLKFCSFLSGWYVEGIGMRGQIVRDKRNIKKFACNVRAGTNTALKAWIGNENRNILNHHPDLTLTHNWDYSYKASSVNCPEP